ncbi:TetR/AcrR family transcriptional regulator [Streptomyces justiciae]|uniref:TetR/AcrR family transcriptional regulator n=1 Tax=Streptomyces justiciae TaxID=2780140 RepID=A0ABU3LVS4_9ACTN|nr:TetR/AcrR family transcriptional regulator [Streptomyces justiciae]MBE8477530.1 TetR/AcrR family transcriptional regulator [Streptomyces justiciae]MCW8380655.1 TetR/AcrR family transcriptional regulator [Streptomyces justiciae]MDT7843336.1 TetR/AcrR family transcriptional regulator [Streptomyces justiciae]
MAPSSTPRGSRLLPSERRDQILAVARQTLEKQTIDDITVESVAGEAGVSPGLLFHYFGSQRKFRHAILQAASDELLTHLRPDPSLSPVEQLRTGIETFVAYVARHPAVYRAVTRLNTGGTVRTLHSSVRATLAGWITEAFVAADAPASPALGMSVAGWLAYMEEVVLAWLDKPDIEQDELIDLCERVFYQIVMVTLDDTEQYEQLLSRMQERA